MPKLSELGAYSKFNHVYSQAVIKDLIEFARYRGVRIIPEFDTPGHTESWGPGAGDGFLTKCCDSQGVPDGTVGPIDPSVQANYDLMKTLFGEVKNLFKDEFIHLGGDEVPFNCWQSNPNITKASLHAPYKGDALRSNDWTASRLYEFSPIGDPLYLDKSTWYSNEKSG